MCSCEVLVYTDEMPDLSQKNVIWVCYYPSDDIIWTSCTCAASQWHLLIQASTAWVGTYEPLAAGDVVYVFVLEGCTAIRFAVLPRLPGCWQMLGMAPCSYQTAWDLPAALYTGQGVLGALGRRRTVESCMRRCTLAVHCPYTHLVAPSALTQCSPTGTEHAPPLRAVPDGHLSVEYLQRVRCAGWFKSYTGPLVVLEELLVTAP